MSQIEVKLEMDTGAGDTLSVTCGVTSDFFLPIWEIGLGLPIGNLHGLQADGIASILDGAIESIRWFPSNYEGLSAPQQERIGEAEKYLERWRDLCRQHPRCRIRLLGGSIVFPPLNVSY
jgi:hypothetical protein